MSDIRDPSPPHPARAATEIYTRPERVVLVLQGGGALGAYQGGVYAAMHAAGVEPDWVIGTSIGAINGALIAGNRPSERLRRLRAFWDRVALPANPFMPRWGGFAGLVADSQAMINGVPNFYQPNPAAWHGLQARVGTARAGVYRTDALRKTLAELTELDGVAERSTRLTVGAVNVASGRMRYFDSDEQSLEVSHVLASAALPPAFPAVNIDGEFYWDGGVYSNTPLEVVFDDKPRRNSLIFAINLWHLSGPPPQSLWDVLSRQKDIQFSSRGEHHIEDERNLHHLRRVINELATYLPQAVRDSAPVRELTAWGTRSTMHVVRLFAPRLSAEDHTKDIDFTRAGIDARWQAGFDDTRAMLSRAPWLEPLDPLEGVHIHTL